MAAAAAAAAAAAINFVMKLIFRHKLRFRHEIRWRRRRRRRQQLPAAAPHRDISLLLMKIQGKLYQVARPEVGMFMH